MKRKESGKKIYNHKKRKRKRNETKNNNIRFWMRTQDIYMLLLSHISKKIN